ncbi:hypothetical protein Dsin_027475 [Dipteronia sinensis]|uniref:Mediator complex subunit 15 KIX domain-containing protein n=1 Tax=Dipteronia sinensis TaxID=43782 RepID=A0AAE0DTN8_9ROSI|nr:hypothetical protein Dsin_027475 [Dipteronia sinensis]
MDNNNWRPAPPGGEPNMETPDWRTQLQPDSRQRNVNQIMDTLKRHLPFSGPEGLNELKKIAGRIEKKIYTAATDQSDYLRRISLKMHSMESKFQSTMSNSLQPNSGGTSNNPPDPVASLDSTAGQSNGGDWQEEVYQKIKVMKEMYFPELNEMYQKIATKLQQHDSLPQQPKSEQLEKLKIFKNMLERIIGFLQVSKINVLPGYKDKLGSYEKQIVNFINTNRPRKLSMQQGQHPPPHMHSMQQPSQVQSHDNQMNPQMQSMNLQGSVATMQQNNMTSLQHNAISSISGVSTAQHNMLNSLQSGSNLDSGQGNTLNSFQQVAVGSLPQNSVTASQQVASLDSTAGQSNGGDWQEEVYQKIKVMKEMYFPELNEMYQKIATKLQQHDSLPQQPKSEQLEKLKIFKNMLERIIGFLQVTKINVLPGYKDKLGSYEKQIVNFINTNRPRKPSMQQGQHPPPHMHSMQQPSQVQSHDNQMNPQMQSMNLQGSVATMQQNNMTSLQHNAISSMSGVSTAQHNMLNSLQSGSNLDSGQGNTLNSLQQVAVGSLPQNSVTASQQANINTLSSQSGVNMLQSTINPLQSNSNMLQHPHLKQQQPEQQLLQSQQLKQQIQQRQIQQQLLQKQQQLHQQQQQQQLHQQAKQQLPAQLQTHQMQQLHQMNDVGDLKMRQGMGVKPGVFQQHMSSSQRPAYSHQQLKPGASFPISSPQLLQAASPQMPQHPSPHVDQQNLLSSLPKTGTPSQSANSPFVVPSPSTPLAPSPMPGDSEKPISGISSFSNAGNIGHQQTTSAQAAAPSLAIGTPGISASPLLAEFTGPDGTHGTALVAVPGKSSATEQPLERLLKAVKSMSPKTLSASVSDIGSVVSMIDRIAGSAPGNGSRAAVGEDLVAMTKCRLQARNFIIQDGMTGPRKMRRYTSAMPLNVVSSAGSVSDSFKQLIGADTSDLESTATSGIKRPRFEANHVLLEEIREINQRLIDTVVDISDEDVDPTAAAAAAAAEGGEGTIVKCSFNAVALSPNLKSQYASSQMSPIQPLRLLVPTNYPNCSPILLDKFPVEVSKEYEDVSVKAKSSFSISLRSLSQPMSLWDIARTWHDCARTVISEYAQQSGGGSFSSKYGTWEDCLSAA